MKSSNSTSLNQSESQEKFQELLKKQGLKLTQQRKEILDYLLKSKKHMTAEQIYRDIIVLAPNLGRATVFRTLKLMEEAGVVTKILLADGQQAFEHHFSRPHHDHLICVLCNEVIEFANPKIEAIQEEITNELGFSPLWHRHEIFGHCKKCHELKNQRTGTEKKSIKKVKN